jgi:hypothetical protein
VGNAPVHDVELARWAAHGNHNAFGMLFERHLVAVYEAAWDVVRDREIAAEIARDTFNDAWNDVTELPPEAFVDELLDLARHNAFSWLTANPGIAGPEVAFHTDPTEPLDGGPPPPATAPSLGPVLRTRIVSWLEVQGIPVRVKAQEAGAPTGPVSAAGPRPAAYAMSRWDPIMYRLSGLFERTGPRVGAAALAVAVLAVAGFVVVGRGGGGGADDTEFETTSETGNAGNAGGTDPDDRAAGADDPDEASSTTTTGEATTTTTSPGASTTTAGNASVRAPGTTRPASGGGGGSPTTATPTTAKPSPATTAAPSVPTILEFDGYTTGQGSCPSGQVNFVMHWRTAQATWIWVHTEGAVWEDIDWSQRPNGSTSRCTTSGTKWYLEIRRDGDWLEDTATTYV